MNIYAENNIQITFMKQNIERKVDGYALRAH